VSAVDFLFTEITGNMTVGLMINLALQVQRIDGLDLMLMALVFGSNILAFITIYIGAI
jgi:hypothetical protein